MCPFECLSQCVSGSLQSLLWLHYPDMDMCVCIDVYIYIYVYTHTYIYIYKKKG